MGPLIRFQKKSDVVSFCQLHKSVSKLQSMSDSYCHVNTVVVVVLVVDVVDALVVVVVTTVVSVVVLIG